jgi:hypothetical protein
VIYGNTRIQIPEQRTIGKERIKRKEEPRNIQKTSCSGANIVVTLVYA